MKQAFSLFCLSSSIAFSLLSAPISPFESTSLTAEKLKPWMLDFQNNLPKLPVDPRSNSEPEKAITTHLVWDVVPNFEKKQLAATATYSYDNKIDGNSFLTLDVDNLEIQQVLSNGKETTFEIIPSISPSKPDALRISIPEDKGTGEVSIRYNTTTESTAVFWIDKEYTHGKNHPLLYTLFQENEGASAIPGQHSPKIRMTYEVNAKTKDADLMVLSSVSNNPRSRNSTGEYSGLTIGRAVPLYLLSLQVGNFTFQPYEGDSRTGVYSEEAMIDQASKAFSFLPNVMKAAEEICGPYNWGTYTPILLSWAFPYMAMEHPCASTCGAITLDHPSVIPHELAHSWAGNDITNANWQQLFWNEGLTTYLEYQICAKVWGTDYASMSFLYTLEETYGAMDEYRKERPDMLRLCQETDDQEFTRIPYGKGALFFFMLEKAMGPTTFQSFVKDYMNIFFQNSMSDPRFLAYLEIWLEKEANIQDFEGFMKEHQINEWLYGMEIPSNAPTFQSTFINDFFVEATKLFKHEKVDLEKFNNWDITTQSLFLGSLSEKASIQDLIFLDEQLNLTKSTNMSIREEWARLCAIAGYINSETTQMIVDYIIERNSAHKANQISTILSKTKEGQTVIKEILLQDNKRLFPLVRKKILKNALD